MSKGCFLVLGSLVFALTSACSDSDEGPGANVSTIRTREAFCAEWGLRACGAEVVDVCQAQSVEDCRESQAEFCLSIVPTAYSSAQARACLTAVEQAYSDAELDAEELLTVRELGAPCHQLVVGTGGVGDVCSADVDCNTPAGLLCVIKGGSTSGTCQEPDEVGGGFDCSAPERVCEDGFYCNGENCVAYRRVTATCATDGECGPEAYCEIDPVDAQKVCVARGEVGDTCTTGRECVSEICLELANGESLCINNVRLSPSEPLCQNLR